MVIKIRVDINDGDFVTIKKDFNINDLQDIKLMIEALSKFKSYKIKNWHFDHNFCNGRRYGFDMCRSDAGEKSPFEYYVKGGLISKKVFDTFKKYVKNRTFHTVKQIKIDNELFFKKENYTGD